MHSYIQFYTPAQVADMMQLNILTVYSFIKRNKLAAVKIGRSYRIEKSDFEQFIKKNKNTGFSY